MELEPEQNEDIFYAFTFQNGGFVIVPAEDVLPPVLGYSLEGFFPEKASNLNFDSFMENYTEQIILSRSNNLKAETSINESWDKYLSGGVSDFENASDNRGVSPLLTCLWNQGNPYNKLCPEDPAGPGGHVYAGCVATAMSMVMYYWRYPLQGAGYNSYYWPPYGTISANFGATEYNWNQMMDVIDPDYTDIALIQFHCGVSIDMMYSPNGSGAYSWDVPPAIKNHFGYSSEAQFLSKDNYSQNDWINILKEQIDSKQPMYYSGFSNSGGHAFVCDGYDDNDYFHFNFGWGGSANGFYTLYSVGGFNDGQGIVRNFFPGGDYPYYFTGQQTLTATSGTFEDGSGPAENYLPDAEASWLITPQSEGDSISSITLTLSRFEVSENDELIVYDGESTDSEILAVLTGYEIPAAVTSTGNKMLVSFKSNDASTANGWLAAYTTESPVWCSGLVELNEPNGEISDGSFDFFYDNSSVCLWRIEPENAVDITFYFTSFDTEDNCDVVMIFDLETQEILAEYSGSFLPGNLPEPVTSPSGKMFIAFSTNGSVTEQGWEGYYISTFVGLEENNDPQQEISIYPNPADDFLNIKLNFASAGNYHLSLLAPDGKIIFQDAGDSQNSLYVKLLNVAELGTGIYIIRITTPKSVINRKVIIR